MTDELTIVQSAYADMETAWARLLQENSSRQRDGRDWVDIACQRGCAACCTYLPDCKSSEAALLADLVEHSAPEQRQTWLDRLYAWRDVFTDWHHANPDPHPREHFADHVLWRARWQLKRLPCPFLDLATHACTVYESRPAVCRSCHAGYPTPDEPQDHVPPDGCFTAPEEVETGTIHYMRVVNANLNSAFSQHLADRLNDAGVSWHTSIIAIAVLEQGEQRYAWRHPDHELPAPSTLEHALP